MKSLSSIIVEFDINKKTVREIPIADLNFATAGPSVVYWIHCDLTQGKACDALLEKLRLPENVLKLCREDDAMPKLQDAEGALSLKIQGLVGTEFASKALESPPGSAGNDIMPSLAVSGGGSSTLPDEVEFTNLIIHLTYQYCFTASNQPLPALQEFLEGSQRAVRYAKTPCFILFLICDNTINDYSKLLFNIELVTEQMEIDVRSADKDAYNTIMHLKQQVMKTKHNTIALREILMRISDRKISVISDMCRSSLYNLSSHSHMVVHEADSIRDMLKGLLDQIDNTLMQNLNGTMRVLTAFAAIFLPLSLITGIYGMNFQHIPELSWRFGYFYALGLLAICAALLLYFFKKNKWF